ncbi:hypothetical protein A2X44_00915 [candidate division CPR3 bacterium GWF2_35_18]|uniref:Nucleotide pyrophosphohydrolase n=1 Tax=candidate division CPR3 bacterium GW2011_GWF2_35_18 TaxID=1618350 RepID=A0A0G0BLE9_UNCC3|nr:MAG: Nucleotide pyrophosphohydrolase [candidate division CPR3 bacterium GW2011_GWF2_35_18]KKP86148.1 MAG: Nucleotide pyrophosphohydrolase [candidate division CPR3 bacterium GW2011_GWE2_35_7]OGB63466.1 MAG: hypothetical protein A2X44_00915 [candidate division CPR3 bacterium GWF2_35_18]OGB76911.1 MAG: hypothetical protein A2476_02385 [candidate division CPR3 bacterium RIFOXYC2_FULL_35_7]OGB78584.1 MAG: hypothetical protein A2296_01520 [candidate division CPR3 bacterium RIFOXYB2_FULL_35_8]OGB8
MNDQNTTIAELRKEILEFRDRRKWKKYNTVKDLAISIVIEMGELMEHFQWKSEALIKNSLKKEEQKREIQREFADVINYLFTLSDELGIDIVSAVKEKLALQEQKFPIAKMLSWEKMKEEDVWSSYHEIRKQHRLKS